MEALEMNAIGIRASNSEIIFSVVDKNSDSCEILTIDKFIVPKALDMPDRLSYIRNSFESIIKEFNITKAGVRIQEMVQRVTNNIIERIYIEGVLQELFSNSTVCFYFAGRKNTIAKLLETTPENVSSFMNGETIFNEIEGWETMDIKKRESIIAAFASCRIGE